MSRLVIFGPGGFGREVMASAQNAVGMDGVVFCADEPGRVLGMDIIGPDEVGGDDEMVIALGDGLQRKSVAERFPHARGGQVVAPSAIIGPDCELGEGAVICDFSLLTASVRIGKHFQCNIYSYIAHDCVIGDFVTFAPRVACNGNVHIGDGAYIGTGAIIRNGSSDRPLRIGAGATVGMGAVVTKDVEDGATVVGNPARPFTK